MRILLVSASYRPYPSGVGEHVHHLALELKRRGHNVHILTTNYPIPRKKRQTFSLAEEDPDQKLPITRFGRALILPANRSHFVLPVGFKLPGQVKRFLSLNQFDLLHCHGLFPPELAYWAIRNSRSPVVVTFHTFRKQFPKLIRQGLQVIFTNLQEKVKVKIAVSRAARDFFSAWFPGDYQIIPNGIDTTRFRPDVKPPAFLCDGCPTILFVGRLDSRKGLLFLISALPEILKAHPQTKLVVVGIGPLLTRARKLIALLGVEKSVTFVGNVSPNNLPGYYAGCTVFVSPALSGEAMGIVLLEALASGKPVVASAIPGYNEVITHGENGLLIPPGDVPALSQAIIQLLDSLDLRHRLSQQALAHSRNFAWPIIARRVEEAYQTAF